MSEELRKQARLILDEAEGVKRLYESQGVTAGVDKAATLAINHMSAFGATDGAPLFEEDEALTDVWNRTVEDLVAIRNRTYTARLKDPVAEGVKGFTTSIEESVADVGKGAKDLFRSPMKLILLGIAALGLMVFVASFASARGSRP